MSIDNRELATALEQRACEGTCSSMGQRDRLCYELSEDPTDWCVPCLLHKASRQLIEVSIAYERGYSDSLKDGMLQIGNLTDRITRLETELVSKRGG